MILHAFEPDRLADALRWSAAGGLALHLRPKAGERLTCWEAGTKYGPDRGDLYGCDPEALRLTCKSVWVNRVLFKCPASPAQHVTLAGTPLGRILKRSDGCVWRAPWFNHDEAVGRFWCGLTRRTPARTTLRELQEPHRGWVGPTPKWQHDRPGHAFYAVLPGGDPVWEGCVIGQAALDEMSGLASQYVHFEPVVRQVLASPAGRFRCLTGVAARLLATLYQLLGAVVCRRVGMTATECGWASRRPQAARNAGQYRDDLKRWGMTPDANDLLRAEL